MAMSHVITALCFCLPSLTQGATLHSDKEHNAMMRRQGNAVQLSSSGNMIVEGASAQHSSPKVRDLICNISYVIGNAPADITSTGAVEDYCPPKSKIMETPDLCLANAKLACPDESCYDDDEVVAFTISDNLTETCGENGQCGSERDKWEMYPRGCFKTDGEPPKWRYNPNGAFPTNGGKLLLGTPVCQKAEYINAKPNSDDCGDTDYELITVGATNTTGTVMDENDAEFKCEAVNICLGKDAPEFFRTMGVLQVVGTGADETAEEIAAKNAAAQEKVPKGCHMVAPIADNKVMFNPSIADARDAAKIKGEAICKLKMDVKADGFKNVKAGR